MSSIGMIAHPGTQTRGWGNADVPVGLLAVLAVIVLAVMVVAARPFRGSRLVPPSNARRRQQRWMSPPSQPLPCRPPGCCYDVQTTVGATGGHPAPARSGRRRGARLAGAGPRPAWQLDSRVCRRARERRRGNLEIPLRSLTGLVVRPGTTSTSGAPWARSRGGRAIAGARSRRQPPRSRRRVGRRDLHSLDGAVRRRCPRRAADRQPNEPRRVPREVPAGARRRGRQGRPVQPNPGVPQRHPRADRDPDRRYAGDRKGRPCTRTPRSVVGSRSASPRSATAGTRMTGTSGRLRCREASIGGSSPRATG